MYTYKINNSYTVNVNYAYYNECKKKTNFSNYKSISPASYSQTSYITNRYPEQATYTKPLLPRKRDSSFPSETKRQEQVVPPIINTKVNHKEYGSGAIIDFDKTGHIFVSFGETIKQFVYPSAFQQGFLAYA